MNFFLVIRYWRKKTSDYFYKPGFLSERELNL